MSVVYGLSKAPALTWSSNTVWEFIVGGIVLLMGFILNESYVSQPLMPLEIFKIRNVLGGNLAFLVIACTLFSMFFFLTLYIQTVLGYSPVKTGLCFLPITVIVGITSGIVSNLVGKIGYKPPLVAGPIFISLGLFILSNIIKVDGNYWHNRLSRTCRICIRHGLYVCIRNFSINVWRTRNTFSGLASGILNTSQQVGGAIGLAILSAVALSTVKSDLLTRQVTPLVAQVNGYSHGMRVGSILALAAVT